MVYIIHSNYLKGNAMTVIKLICNICSRYPKNHKEAMEINAYGCHLTCDHVMGDINA